MSGFLSLAIAFTCGLIAIAGYTMTESKNTAADVIGIILCSLGLVFLVYFALNAALIMPIK